MESLVLGISTFSFLEIYILSFLDLQCDVADLATEQKLGFERLWRVTENTNSLLRH